MELISFLIGFKILLAVTGTAVIDPKLQHAYDIGEQGSQENVLITFDTSYDLVIESINTQNYSTLHEKRTALTQAQQKFANEIQGPLQKFLLNINVGHETFWINNKMYVPSASAELVQVIANFPGVAKIRKEQVITLDPIHSGEVEDFANKTVKPKVTLEWGIKRIHAPKVWKKGIKGKGIVVANIDTGVHYTHESLKGGWRKKHGWFDPYRKTKFPYDKLGHGTHTMGTIVGTHGIGVAPEATWIACLACGSRACLESGFLKCGQWVQCPTDQVGKNPDCKLAPDVVSNSWGDPEDTNFFYGVIASWQAAGIIPVFSVGNQGGFCSATGINEKCCGTTRSPGDGEKVISVGSIDKKNRVSVYSSRGPTKNKKIKPDIVAPGRIIRSAWHTSDTAYNTLSGSTMACPHVAGVVALMRQKSKHAKYAKIYKAITSSAQHDKLDFKGLPNCGGIKSSKFPNNIYGHGLVSAEKAVGALK